MRQTVFLVSVILLLWIAGATYWYVCRIRCDCKEAVAPAIGTKVTGDTLTPTPEQLLQVSLDEAKGFLSVSGVQKGFFTSSSATGDMSSITGEYVEKLKLVLENNPSARVEVTGHADVTGTEAWNNELGLRRAEYTKTFLVNTGIKAEQIITLSKGSSEPAASNSTPEGRAANRRSEIKVII